MIRDALDDIVDDGCCKTCGHSLPLKRGRRKKIEHYSYANFDKEKYLLCGLLKDSDWTLVNKESACPNWVDKETYNINKRNW